MQDKEEERSMVNVENRLQKDGYTTDFKVDGGRLCAIGTDKTYGEHEVKIVDFYRFEGETNPDDMAILYAIETSDGLKGTIANSYGPYADSGVDEFLRKIEDIGKNLDKSDK